MDWWYGVRPNRSHCPALSQNLDCQKCRLTQCTIFQDPGDIFKLFSSNQSVGIDLNLICLGLIVAFLALNMWAVRPLLWLMARGEGDGLKEDPIVFHQNHPITKRGGEKHGSFFRYHIQQAPLGLTWGFVYFLFKSSSSIFFLAWLDSSCSIANRPVELT